MKAALVCAGLLFGTVCYGGIENNAEQSTQQKPAVDASMALHHVMATMCESMDSMKLSGDLNKDFITMMIPHHQSAIDMSEAYLTEGKDPQLVEMANKIIEAQKKEIEELQAKLKELISNANETSR